MGLQAWWIQTRLNRVEQKIKKLRSKQKHLRADAEDLAKDKKRSGDTDALRQKETKLQAERERVTAQISELLAREEALKRELDAARHPAATPAES